MILERRNITRTSIDRRAILSRPPEPISKWLKHVKKNHGGVVSQRTIRALSKFYWDIKKNNGLFNKIFILNCLVPDSFGACITPLIDATGKHLWINQGCRPSDLNINGISPKSGGYLNTQFNPLLYLVGPNDGGATTWVSESNTDTGEANGYFFGSGLSGGTEEYRFRFKQGNRDWMHFADGISAICYSNIYGSDESTWQRGYISYNRTSSTTANIWKANEQFSHFDDISLAATNAGSVPNFECYFLSSNISDVSTSPTRASERFSFMAAHSALTESESQHFYNAILLMRQRIGGGFKATL